LRFHLVSINCRYSHSCLAQFYLRNVLEKRLDCSTRLSQYTINDPYYQTLLRLTSIPCRAVFFSVYIWNHRIVRRLLADLCRLVPELPVILGGPQAASLGKLPEQCSLVIGEIEGMDDDFFSDLAAGELRPVYHAGAARDFPSPYQGEDFNGPLKNRQLYYESSRGCPFFCAYCLSSISRGVRHKPLEQVRGELAQLIAARPMIIKFVDRTFNDRPDRALAIWRFLVDQAKEVKCHFEIAPDRFTEQMFTFLASVPCDLFQFEIGIQSCSPQTLAAVNRQMDVEAAGNNIRRLIALDTIHIHVDLILGLPYETATSFRDSFNRVFSFEPHYIQLGLLKVLPDTEMARRADEYGLVFCSEPPYEVLATRWMDHETLRDLYEFCECVESFYNNRFFRSLWQYLARNNEEPFVFFTGLLDCCRKHDFFQLAATQKLMTEIFCVYAGTREDGEVLLDLLRYDWLRCGHRRLPDCLADRNQEMLRDRLRRKLPQNINGFFDYRSRVEFFKQATFLELSGDAAAILVPDYPASSVIAFLPELTQSVMKFCSTLVLSPEA
jgi:radical SAM superfamily enzyme YgiQ (UPF0313 family)